MRVEFFARTGVAWEELRRRLIEKHMVEGQTDDTQPGILRDLRDIARAVAPPRNMTYGGPIRGRFPRPGEQNAAAASRDYTAAPPVHRGRRLARPPRHAPPRKRASRLRAA